MRVAGWMPALTRLLHCGNGLRVLHALTPYPVGTTLTDVALTDNHLDWPALAPLGALPAYGRRGRPCPACASH
jgi:hypothetical protein